MLPSGWSPLELVKHLTFVEMRWLEWGFEGAPVDDPWGDQRDGRWHVGPEETLDGLLAALDRRGRGDDGHRRPARPGRDRRTGGAVGRRRAGHLERVLLHLVQEYARHWATSTWCASCSTAVPASGRAARRTRTAPVRHLARLGSRQ